MDDSQGTLFGVVASLAILAIFGAATCFAPCSWYGCAPITAVPARCIDGVKR